MRARREEREMADKYKRVQAYDEEGYEMGEKEEFQMVEKGNKQREALKEKVRLEINEQEQKRVQVANMKEKSAVLVELQTLNKQLAVEGSSKLEEVVKNYKETKTTVVKTKEVVQQTKEENVQESGRYIYYLLMLLFVLLLMIIIAFASN